MLSSTKNQPGQCRRRTLRALGILFQGSQALHRSLSGRQRAPLTCAGAGPSWVEAAPPPLKQPKSRFPACLPLPAMRLRPPRHWSPDRAVLGSQGQRTAGPPPTAAARHQACPYLGPTLHTLPTSLTSSPTLPSRSNSSDISGRLPNLKVGQELPLSLPSSHPSFPCPSPPLDSPFPHLLPWSL